MRTSEHDRFWRYVVKGPAADDCWLWTGAVSDDGYGRFWIKQDGGRQRAVRPQRYAYEEATGVALPSSTLLLHGCDVPLCVHADVDPELSHVTPEHTETTCSTAPRRAGTRTGGRPFTTAAYPGRIGCADHASCATACASSGGTRSAFAAP